MSSDKNDVVRVAAGEMLAMEFYKEALTEAGIEARVVGDDLGASFGSAIQGSVELWVHQGDAARAETIIQSLDSNHGKAGHEKHKHPHPTSEPKTKQQGGHGPHTHYDSSSGK